MLNLDTRRLAAALAVAALAALGAGCGSESDSSTASARSEQAKPASSQAPSWLWVQQARRGTFSHGSQGWQLTLTGAQDDLAAFSDRPHRLAQVEPLADFLAQWNMRFGSSHPNAAVVIPRSGDRSNVLVVTLHEPVVESRDASKVVYRASIVPLSQARKALPEGTQETSTKPPSSFTNPVLFIDSYQDGERDGGRGPDGNSGSAVANHAEPTIFMAVRNDEEQYSIWPADRELPLGWYDTGRHGTKSEVLAYIEEVWTDQRPLSLRKKMQAMGLG